MNYTQYSDTITHASASLASATSLIEDVAYSNIFEEEFLVNMNEIDDAMMYISRAKECLRNAKKLHVDKQEQQR